MKNVEYHDEFLDDQFKSNLMLAIGIHVLIVLLFFVISKIAFKVTHSSSRLEVIKSAVRVDVVGMPKFTLQELKKIEEVPPTTEEAPKRVALPEKVEKEKEIEIKKGDVVQEKLEKEKRKKKLSSLLGEYSKKPSNKKTGAIVLEGNKVSKGTALTGEYADEASTEFSGYVGTLPDLIRRNWKLPGFLRERDLKCRIRIYIGLRGQIIKIEIFESSGVSDYDERAIGAVQASAPFPAPSSSVAKRLISDGIVLGFPL